MMVMTLPCGVGTTLAAEVKELKDPTEPSSYVPDGSETKIEDITHYALDAIVISGDSRLAIINNRILKVGDVVGEEQVKAIDTNSVTLIGAEGETVLRLFGKPVKRPIKETSTKQVGEEIR